MSSTKSGAPSSFQTEVSRSQSTESEKVKEEKKTFVTQIICCTGVMKRFRWINSVALWVFLIFVTTVGTVLGFLVLVSIGSASQFSLVETRRARLVEQVVNKVSSLVSLVEMEIKAMTGTALMSSDRFLSSVIDGNLIDERMLMWHVHEMTESFYDNYGSEFFTLGYFIYESNPLDQWTKLYSVGYDNGFLYAGVSDDYLSLPPGEKGNITLEYYDVEPSTEDYLNDGSWLSKNGDSIKMKRNESEFAQHLTSDVFEWSFYSSGYNGVVTPFLSFLSSQRDNGYFDSKFGNGKSYSVVSWFGSTGNRFSGIVQAYTPGNTVSWIIELKNGILLSASDSNSFADLVQVTSDGKNDYISPVNYKTEVVRTVSAELLDTDVLGWILGADPSSKESVQTYALKGYEILVFFRNSSYNGEFLVVNAKSTFVAYQDAVVTMTLSIGVTVFCIVLTLVLWVKIMKGFGKAQTMNLNHARQDERIWSYFEVQKLKDGINMMLDKLVEFKSFLPDHVLDGTQSEYSRASNSITSSDSSTDSATDYFKDVSEGSKDLFSSVRSIEKTKSMKINTGCRLGLDQTTLIMLKIFFGENEERVTSDMEYLRTLGFGNAQDSSKLTLSYAIWRSFFEDVHASSERNGGHIAEFKINSATVLFTKSNFNGAVNCLNFLRNVKLSSKMTSCRFRMCMDTAYIGNVGCYKKRFFTFGGNVRNKMSEIERSGAKRDLIFVLAGIKSVICDKCHSAMSSHGFESRVVEKIVVNGVEESIWELGRKKKIKEDEWMYELQEMTSFGRWDSYNTAVKLFFDGSKNSKRLITQYCEDDPKDELARYWRGKILKSHL